MDTELVELCAKVYKLTGWGFEEGARLLTHYGEDDDNEQYPAYTSDFLLEKLPAGTEVEKLAGLAPSYRASRFSIDNIYSHADTPLKALLKLTLALHEAGELK